MNRDVEMLKLTLAGNSYEATLQTFVSATFAAFVSLIILGVTLLFQLANSGGLVIFAFFLTAATVFATVMFRYSLRRYKNAITKLDQHIGKLNSGESVPSLDDLLS